MGCDSIDTNPEKGKICGSTVCEGLIFWDSNPGKLDKDSIKALTFWDAQAKLDKPNRAYFMYKMDETEPADPEDKTQDLNIAGEKKTGRTPEKSEYRFQSGKCNLHQIYGGFNEGRSGFVLRMMSDGTLRGKEVEWGQLEAVEVYISGSYVTPKTDAIGMTVLKVTQTEDYMDQVDDAGDLDFTFTDLDGVSSVQFVNTTVNDATTTTFDAVDCNDTEVTDLTDGASPTHEFGAYDRTDDAELTISDVTATGNRYVLTVTGKVSDHEIEYYYNEPSTTDQLYSTPVRLVLTVP